MKYLIIISFLSCFALQSQVLSFADVNTQDQALVRLKEGNQRFVENKISAPRRGDERRRETVPSQKPFCTILSCSDSRVPVEIIFDQGIGDLFVVRVAGNVANEDEIGSMEYSTDHLNTDLIVVLGHKNCGAVKEALSEAHVNGEIVNIIKSINPAVRKTLKQYTGLKGQQLFDEAVRQNVWQAIEDIFRTSSSISTHVQAGAVKVVGAVYDLESGRVEWLGEHPDQKVFLEK